MRQSTQNAIELLQDGLNRRRRHFPLADLAQSLDIPPAALNAFADGTATLPAESLAQLARILFRSTLDADTMTLRMRAHRRAF